MLIIFFPGCFCIKQSIIKCFLGATYFIDVGASRVVQQLASTPKKYTYTLDTHTHTHIHTHTHTRAHTHTHTLNGLNSLLSVCFSFELLFFYFEARSGSH